MSNERRYLRFPLIYRIEHLLLLVSFTTLAVTGLVQKFAEAPLSMWIVGALSGIQMVRIIHRVAATILMLEVIIHIGSVGYKLFILGMEPSMLPGARDLKVAYQTFLHNLGIRDERPKQGRYTFEEKAEYWAVVWGTIVMGITGFMLWNPIATTEILPGEWVAAAKAAHGGEALLAVLAIIVWHLYHVHIRHFNKSMFTGYLSEEEMQEEHPLELEQIRASEEPEGFPQEEVAKRSRIFWPAYGVLAAAMLVGVYFFVTFEETAIETLPPDERRVEVFAPLTPTPRPAPITVASELTVWEGEVGFVLNEKCTFCHGGASPVQELDLTSYEAALLGGASNPAIVPGDPAASELVIRQSTGDHPVQLTEQELEAIVEWIEEGAPRS